MLLEVLWLFYRIGKRACLSARSLWFKVSYHTHAVQKLSSPAIAPSFHEDAVFIFAFPLPTNAHRCFKEILQHQTRFSEETPKVCP